MSPTAQAKDALRTAAAALVKELIWRYGSRFSPKKKPICLYASRRSGSSLLMQMIGANRGVMFSDQPFGLYTASSATINRLPIFPYGQIAYPDPGEMRIFQAFLDDLLAGKLRANAPWKIWSKDFHFWNDRLCLKITDAKAMIDWIDRHYDVCTVVLTRHPVAQALSVDRNQWFVTGKGLLRNPEFLSRWVPHDLEAYCWDIYRNGDGLSQRIVDWSLENLVMLSLLPQRSHWLYVSYEDLVAQPSAVINYLSTQLELPDVDAMLAQLKRPSRSTFKETSAETRAWIHGQHGENLLTAWRRHIDEEQLKACFRILDRFQLDLYSMHSDAPQHARLARPGFAAVEGAPCNSA